MNRDHDEEAVSGWGEAEDSDVSRDLPLSTVPGKEMQMLVVWFTKIVFPW